MDFISQILAENPIIITLYRILRGILIVLNIILFGIFVFAVKQLLKYRPKFVYDPRQWQKHVRKRKQPQLATPATISAWNKVQAKLKDGSPDALRLAIVEADGIVDDALKRMGLAGETFAERLGRIKPGKYSSLDALWDAHRIRNNLVHTPDFSVPLPKAEEAVAAYEAFLKEIKALQTTT